MTHTALHADMARHVPTTDTARRAFFAALTARCPDDLSLELRAIHPVTHKAKSLWATIGDKPALAKTFQQIEKLNREGYGAYFAPCLRSSPHQSSGGTNRIIAVVASAT